MCDRPPNRAGMDRRRRLELAIPFWTYLALIAIGVTIGIVVGLTHH